MQWASNTLWLETGSIPNQGNHKRNMIIAIFFFFLQDLALLYKNFH